MMRRPPSSTLLPYAALFRSPDIAESLGLSEPKGALVADVVKDGPAAVAGIKQGDVIVEYDGKPVSDSAELPDRKSTRLNSHSQISYAVFCLKKNNVRRSRLS